MTDKNTALAVVTPHVAIERKEYEFTQDQVDLIKRTVAPGTSNDEFSMFMYVAKARNLDPLQRQIHCVKRRVYAGEENGQAKYEERMTIQTGIDGYRAIANRTGLYMPSEKAPLIEGSGTPDVRVTVFVKKWSEHDRQWHEFSGTAYYREYVQTKRVKDGTKYKDEPVAMWKKMPIGQTTKCAEALALRKGWPEELGMIRTDEEMQQADSHTPEVIPPTATDDKTKNTSANKTRDVGTLEASKSQNRGHGNENTHGSTQTSPKTSEAVKSSVNASDGQSTAEPNPKEDARGWVLVERVTLKSKKPDAKAKKKAADDGKPEPEDRRYFELKVVDRQEHEAWLYVWHKSVIEIVPQMLKHWCDLGLSKQQKDSKTFYSVESVYEIDGVGKFVNNKRVDAEGEVTAQDVKTVTGTVMPTAAECGFRDE